MWFLIRVFHLNLEKLWETLDWNLNLCNDPTIEIPYDHWLTVSVTHPWSSRWAMQKDFPFSFFQMQAPSPALKTNKTKNKNKQKNLVLWHPTLPRSKEGKFLGIVTLRMRLLKAQHRNHSTEAQNLFKIQNVCSWTRRGVSTYIYVPFLQWELWRQRTLVVP